MNLHQGQGCANGCNAPFGVRCSVCNTENRAEPDRSEITARPTETRAWHALFITKAVDRYDANGNWVGTDYYSDVELREQS